MHIDHRYSPDAVILAKVQNYEYWPAFVATCLKNGCYKVSFIGVDDQEIVMPEQVKDFTLENLVQVKKGKEYERNRKLREAICVAIMVAESRKKDGKVIDLTQRRRRNGRLRSRNRQALMKRINEKAEQAEQHSSQRDIETQFKESLDKLARYSSNFLHPVNPVKYTPKDADILMQLLIETQHRIGECLEKWVVEKLIMAITQIHQWSIHPFEYLLPLIKGRYEVLKNIVLSQRLNWYKLTTMRRLNLIKRVESFKVNLITPTP